MFESAILLAVVVFYLYLLVRPQYVKRQFLFMIGCAAVVFSMLGQLLAACGVPTVGGIFAAIGMIAAFVAAFGACYVGELPVSIKLPGDEPRQA